VVVLAELHRKRRELESANAKLASANEALQAEQARELEVLNESLRKANSALGAQNVALHDEIAERRRAEQLLRDADRRKDEFLATLAHELRNPLAPLQNALSIRRLANPDAEDGLQGMMERQLALLVRLIDDLLDIARISQTKLTLRKHPTSLREIIDSAVEVARPAIEQGEHELAVTLPDEAVQLVADQARLSQVFANLLNNAAKYSEPHGRIELVARVDEGRVEVQVRDAGIGLRPDQIDSIFEMFSQVETAIDRTHGGLGIGLTLVRRLTEMHGGEVSVTSEGLGHGATFGVSWPLQPVEELPAVEVVAPEAAQAPVRKRVLVVDDNRDAADTLAMMIEMLGHDVRRLYDPHAVIADVNAFRPQLVFLDVGMPGLSGYELAPRLRALPGLDDLAIVAVTGWGQPEDRRRTREAGFDEHLVKPPPLEDIQRLCSAPSHPPVSANG
jgi:signal transduction histidine kinase/CheY-like chemotaxis protein